MFYEVFYYRNKTNSIKISDLSKDIDFEYEE